MQAVKTQQVLRISLLLFGMYALLAARIFHVQYAPDQKVLEEQASKESRSRWRWGKDLFERPARGQIRDRNLRLLAGSYEDFDLICNPNAKYRKPPGAETGLALYERVEILSELLLDRGIAHDRDQFLIDGTRQYRMVEGDDGKPKAKKIRGVKLLSGIRELDRAYMQRVLVAQGIPNFSFPPVSRREYPQGDLLADVVGKVGWIGKQDEAPRFQGATGLELAYDALLAARPGRFVCEKDGRGQEMDVDGRWLEEPEAGWDLTTSLDLRIQAILDRELAAAVLAHPCSGGAALVMDSQTGEILAVAGHSHDPKKARSGAIALTEAREPGSTIKPLIVAKALEYGLVTWADVFAINGGHHVFRDGKLSRGVHDSHPNGVLDLAGVVIQSSNIGMAMIGAERLGADRLLQALKELELDRLPEIQFPALARTTFPARSENRLDRAISPSFGHAISMSPLMLTTTMNVFATGGLRHEPLLVLRAERDGEVVEARREQKRLLPPEIAQDMLETMARVVEEGTGKVLAKMPWRVAAKTGTAQALPYGSGKYHSSMVAIAPVAAPRLTIYVGLYDVHGQTIYGGSVAGPVIKKVLEQVLPMLGVAPDQEK
ncbi:MAG: penicillin-binding protein 2 [Planctomycetes bacterium]|nr:penicillin-binding protein 2 [Planctomycetota bacterium]